MNLESVKSAIRTFYFDEEGLTASEIIIIIGVVVVPLVFFLMYLNNEINKWMRETWDKIIRVKPTPPSNLPK